MRKPENKISGFMEKLIQKPSIFAEKKVPFEINQIQEIHDAVIPILKKIPNYVLLNAISENYKDVLIIGDTHGELNSMVRIVKPFLEEKVSSLLFLGDYVDRGKDSLVNFMTLLCFMIAWPERVLLLRGNHEDSLVNQEFDFFSSLKDVYSKEGDYSQVVNWIDDIYNHLSLVAITPQKSVCMHGGLPVSVRDIKIFDEIPKPHRLLSEIKNATTRQKLTDAFMQVRWNDPTEDKLEDSTARSYHGYYFFTKSQVSAMLKKGEYKRMIRSHESQRGSFERMFDGKLLHLLSMESESTSNVSMGYYFGNVKKGMLLHEEPDGTTLLRNLDFNLVSKIE